MIVLKTLWSKEFLVESALLGRFHEFSAHVVAQRFPEFASHAIAANVVKQVVRNTPHSNHAWLFHKVETAVCGLPETVLVSLASTRDSAFVLQDLRNLSDTVHGRMAPVLAAAAGRGIPIQHVLRADRTGHRNVVSPTYMRGESRRSARPSQRSIAPRNALEASHLRRGNSRVSLDRRLGGESWADLVSL